MFNKKKLVFLVLFSLVLPFLNINAAEYLPKQEKDIDNVIVNSEETLDGDFYVAGGTILVNPEVQGDLFTFGSSVNVLGGVKEDLFALGGSVIVVKPVLGDVRVGGGNVAVNSQIGEDLLVAGSTVLLDPNTHIGGDLWAMGQTLNLSGVVMGDAKIFGNQVFIDGIISGNLQIRAVDKVTFGPHSKVVGTVTYIGDKDPIIEQGADIGNIVKESLPVTEKESDSVALIIMSFIFRVLTLFITAFVVFKLFKTKTEKFFSEYHYPFLRVFWKNILWGLVFLILTPIVALLLILAMLGVYLGFILIIFYVLVISIALVYSVILFGLLWQKLIKKESFLGFSQNKISYRTVLLGSLTFSILCAVPFVGSLTLGLVFVSLVGAVVSLIKTRMF